MGHAAQRSGCSSPVHTDSRHLVSGPELGLPTAIDEDSLSCAASLDPVAVDVGSSDLTVRPSSPLNLNLLLDHAYHVAWTRRCNRCVWIVNWIRCALWLIIGTSVCVVAAGLVVGVVVPFYWHRVCLSVCTTEKTCTCCMWCARYDQEE
jgi:hypothetical protein